MNAWMDKMMTWRRLIATAVDRVNHARGNPRRHYWDPQSRTWSRARRKAYAWQLAEPADEVRRRSR